MTGHSLYSMKCYVKVLQLGQQLADLGAALQSTLAQVCSLPAQQCFLLGFEVCAVLALLQTN